MRRDPARRPRPGSAGGAMRSDPVMLVGTAGSGSGRGISYAASPFPASAAVRPGPRAAGGRGW
jgi:hypothetical protein